MHIHTKFHGDITIVPEELWTFPNGLLGFEEEQSFVLLAIEGNDLFQVLQSTKTAAIAFVVANPFTFVESYTFAIDDPTIELLNIEEQADVFVLTILTVQRSFEQSTMNLQAPLIFQVAEKKARQMILSDDQYGMKHPIVDDEKRRALICSYSQEK